MIDIAGGQPGEIQAKADRLFRKLMRVVELGLLAVLDPIEPFLLGGGDDLPVDDQGRRRIMENRVDPEKPHGVTYVGPGGLVTERSRRQTRLCRYVEVERG